MTAIHRDRAPVRPITCARLVANEAAGCAVLLAVAVWGPSVVVGVLAIAAAPAALAWGLVWTHQHKASAEYSDITTRARVTAALRGGQH